MRWTWILAGLFTILFAILAPESVVAGGQASIDGRIVDSTTGESLASGHVVLTGSGLPDSAQAESDAAGNFRFPLVEPGNYQLTVKAPGYFPVEYDLVLKPRQPLVLTIEMTSHRAVVQVTEVRASYADIDPGQTGTSRALTRKNLDELPAPVTRSVMALAESLAPGAVLSHDNFVHVRGNELSLHQFINGVSFLDNAHQQFTPGLSPAIFESVNVMTGGFPAEFGNRFGGILDITTRSGRTMNGHGSASIGVGTGLNHDASVDYGGNSGRLGYFFFLSGFESGRFLNPPVGREIHDLGYGSRGAAQLDYQTDKDIWKLLLTGGGTNLELPNTPEQASRGRDAFRRLRSQSAILTWQHIFSPRVLLATSAYQRSVSDRLVPTSDPVTPFAEASRSTLTTGVKSDLTYSRGAHLVKTGIDLALFRLRESFEFDAREEHENHEEGVEEPAVNAKRALLRLPGPSRPASSAGEIEAFAFRGRDLGGQFSFYFQDRLSLLRNLTLDAGARWDQINLVGSYHHVSPRVGLGYYIPQTRSVIHFAYNRFFTPPPLEYVILASYLGSTAPDEDQRGGNARPYTQDYYEVGWNQQLHRKFFLELNAYTHRGRHAFETSEISDTRLFLPTNFSRARASGAEISLRLRQLERFGLSASLQYAVARVHFFGPVSGGFPGEELEPGQRILPAFDQTHTGTANVLYRNRWRDFRTGFIFRYGSGTPLAEEIEEDGQEIHLFARVPQHFTADFSTGVSLWRRDSQSLNFEFDLTNLSNNVYRISKESETTPIQFASRRVVSGRLIWRF